MLRTALLISAGFTLFSSPAFADGTDCPLHARLEAKKAQSVAATVLPATPVAFVPVSAPPKLETRTAPSVPPRSIITSPPLLRPQSADMVDGGTDTPSVTPLEPQASVQLAEAREQESYGSGTEASPKAASLHADWNDVLKNYVSAPDSQGLTHFAYGKLKANMADKAKLGRYIERLEAVDPSTLSENEAIAYYANLYNAVTIQVVTDNYPVKSIRKLGPFTTGPWKKDLFQIKGTDITTLDTLEHGILRKQFPSPYIHYMVNCASVGCPNLLDSAWEADTLSSVRKEAASAYINSPRGAQITSKGLKVSSIYKWFKEDFGGNKEGVLKHIREHANAELAAAIDGGAKIVDYDYDWSLNE